MSIEQLLKENTAALTRMGDLLEISNAARADLLAQAGGTASAAPAASTSSDSDMTVAEIKAAVKDADKATLEAMLTAENDGKARTSAVKAIQDAIDALPTGETTAEEGNESASDAKEPASSTEEQKTNTSAPAADDKNAQPVPAGVTGEQAAGAFGAWFGETDDEDERAKRRAFVGQIVSSLGAKISELDEAGRRKAIFYLRRKRAGLADDFEAAFDFDGSPTQDVPEAAAAEEPAGDPNDDLL